MALNLSLSKKSDAQAVVAPHWHTNFRNFERLPDTKVVRTTFFINTAAVAVTVSLLLWLGYRELHIRNLGDQVAESQREIDANSKQSNEAIRLSKAFDDEEKKLTEAEAFLESPIPPVEFLLALGKSLPKEIAIESVDMRMNAAIPVFTLHGLVAGAADQATGVASNYIDQLRAHPRIGTVFDTITLNNLDRDPARGVMAFDISLKVKPNAKGKKR